MLAYTNKGAQRCQPHENGVLRPSWLEPSPAVDRKQDMLKRILLFLLSSGLAWAHEPYFLQFETGRGLYLLEQQQLGDCRWYVQRGQQLEAFYFRAPDGVQLVLTYPHRADHRRPVGGRVRLMRPGRTSLNEAATFWVGATGSFLYLKYKGSSASGEVWLNPAWDEDYLPKSSVRGPLMVLSSECWRSLVAMSIRLVPLLVKAPPVSVTRKLMCSRPMAFS